MLFMIHVSLALSLIALVAGTMLVVREGKDDACCCKGFAKVVGIIVVILSLLMSICIGYHSFKYWKDPSCMMGKGGMGMMHNKMMKMMDPEMREKMMKEYPMMKKMMGEQGEDKEDK